MIFQNQNSKLTFTQGTQDGDNEKEVNSWVSNRKEYARFNTDSSALLPTEPEILAVLVD